MRRESDHPGAGDGEAQGAGGEGEGDVLTQMIQTLLRDADMPPREVEGVSEEFCDGTVHLFLVSMDSILCEG